VGHLNLIVEGLAEKETEQGNFGTDMPGVMPLLWPIFSEEQPWTDPHHPSGQNMYEDGLEDSEAYA
jgi:hypothetical protein